jgi:hypothetical protein
MPLRGSDGCYRHSTGASANNDDIVVVGNRHYAQAHAARMQPRSNGLGIISDW